jgi:regulator of replication initiation timing
VEKWNGDCLRKFLKRDKKKEDTLHFNNFNQRKFFKNMERGLIIGIFISLILVGLFGGFFYFSKSSPFLAQVSSLQKENGNLKEIENEIASLEIEISNLKKSIKEALSLKDELSSIDKENSKFKEALEKRLSALEEKLKKEKEKIKEIKKEKICEKKEKDLPGHRVIFNEICWMGDEESPANEWIEIKNISKEEIDLSGWQILNKNQRLKIIFEEGTKILPNEILIFKRGDDFSGAIKNSDEALFLFDKDCNLEDEVFATSSWPAGDKFSKRTAERKQDLSWQTSLDPGGTPGKENSSGFVEIEKKEEEKESKIFLSFPKEIFANQEFQVSLSVSDLESETYDIKISILKISDESEQKRTISEISLTGEEWQSSYKYLTKVFSGDSFSGDFKLRISQKYQDFEGEAEILAKVRQSDNKKVVAEFKDKITIKEIEQTKGTEIVTVAPTPSQPTKEPQPPVSLTPLNLLSNEFFESWSKGTSGVPPDDWLWNGASSRIAQSADALVGNYSVELTLTTSEGKEFYQIGKTMNSQTTYYAVVWLKGKGVVKLGIKYPGSTYVYYGDEMIVDTSDWIKIEISRKPANSGNDGGIKLSVKYDESKNIPSGSKLIIGAAWLGEMPPPQDWPK